MEGARAFDAEGGRRQLREGKNHWSVGEEKNYKCTNVVQTHSVCTNGEQTEL